MGTFKGFGVRLFYEEVMYEGEGMEVMGLYGDLETSSG